MKCDLAIDLAYAVGQVDERVFGSFIEHLGRAVYGGVYEPGHPKADGRGFRRDTLDLVRELGVPLVRYPGGNFVSGFRWEDSVGPDASRPRRLDLAWRSVEPNSFGLHEYMAWAKEAGAATMMAVNLGTRGLEAASDLVEYCNHPGGSYLSDRRKANGAADPFGVKLWCLGNEMDGPWQVGHKTAGEYGRLACETSKALKLFDPKLELAVCGSSSDGMPTYPSWEAEVLEHCYDTVDYVSMHRYYNNKADDPATFLASSVGMDAYIRSLAATCDYAKAKARSKKTMMLSFDEWNVWFHSNDADKKQEPWTVGPPLLEDVYTFEDALVVGGLLNSLLRNADRVKIACLAQLVNVIAPIMTSNGGGAWRQTIYWPFHFASRYGRGLSLDVRAAVEAYENPTYGEVPFADLSAVWRAEEGEVALFAVNRSPTENLELAARFGGFPQGTRFECVEHVELAHADLKAVNTEADPDKVAPRRRTPPKPDGAGFRASAAPHSWNLYRLKVVGA
jgi:alpha-N-arabinofuranosidase